ncbi:MAG: hypothetical protein Q9184_004915 [Pyrenodesmia sp. 2 TL-2023]
MKRLLGSIGKRNSQDGEGGIPNGDGPEATIARAIGEEVLHLPVIVEAAESSPAAAREAANRIRKFLSSDNYQRAYVQYNAIMLVRILADNPGKSFTTNLDSKFASSVKELLRAGRDMSVQQILRETLDAFETSKADDETLAPLREMWKKEKNKWGRASNGVSAESPVHPRKRPYSMQRNIPSQPYPTAAVALPDQNYFARNHRPRGLPPPHELAQRVEEARTSSKLLLQVVQSTPPNEVLSNELIKEFVERCQSASRSIQRYINSEDPRPDEDTLLTLIDTNDQISTALSRYQRAMLQARRLTGASPNPTSGGLQRNGTGAAEMPVNGYPPNSGGLYDLPPMQPRTNSVFNSPPIHSSQHQYQVQQSQQKSLPPQPSHFQSQPQPQEDNPFDDPRHETAQAPTDFGLPPSQIQSQPTEPAPFRKPGSGYHPRYETPTSSLDHNERREESGPMYGKRTGTRVDDSDEEEDFHARGQEKGQPVQYRF